VGCVLLPASASAQVTVHTTVDGWLAAVSNPAVDTYNDLPFSLSTSPIARTAGAYSYRGSAPEGFFPAGTPADVWLSSNTASDLIVFDSFSANVRGVGGYFFSSNFLGEFLSGGSLTVTAVSGGQTLTATLNATAVTDFWGITSTAPITSLSIASVQGASQVWPSANDLRLGAVLPPANVVPEPATLVLVALGLGVLVLVAHRRRETPWPYNGRRTSAT
jgi:hypothetical protein